MRKCAGLCFFSTILCLYFALSTFWSNTGRSPVLPPAILCNRLMQKHSSIFRTPGSVPRSSESSENMWRRKSMDYHDKTRKKYSSAVLKEQHMPPAAICGGGPSCETLRIISAPTLLTRAEPLQRSLWRALTTFAAGALVCKRKRHNRRIFRGAEVIFLLF